MFSKIIPSIKEIEVLKDTYNTIPVSKEIYTNNFNPITLLSKISQNSNHFFLFEKTEEENEKKYSFFGFTPTLQVTCKNGEVIIDNGKIITIPTQKPLIILRDLLKNYHSPRLEGMPPFTGGLVGYFSYEMIKYAEPTLKLESSEFNDFNLMLFDKIIAYDHLKQKISIIINIKTDKYKENYDIAITEIDSILQKINNKSPISKSHSKVSPHFTCNITKSEYCDIVERTKEYIKNGDIFQAVISRRLEANYNDSLIEAFRILRTNNPSPYIVFMQSGELQLISASPETLVCLKQSKLSTFPIAGSRPRGKTTEEDIALEKELLNDEKELAEHNMLVDLGRNDIGKISCFNSVRLKKYKEVRRYSRIMHITSKVEGKIRPDKDALDALEAILPAGTLSGAPKIRACEIIHNLEKTQRGIYGGAIGYIDFNGDMDTCIAIRMAIKKDGKIYIQSGGGIVADSNPVKEYEESENKAKAVIESILKAGEVDSNDYIIR